MCGEVWPEHSSPDTDVHGASTGTGVATVMWAASVQRRLRLVDASGVRRMVFDRPDIADVAVRK